MSSDESPRARSFRLTFGKHGRKSVRFDRPPDSSGDGPARGEPRRGRQPERGRLLDRIRRAIRAASATQGADRRASTRHRAVDPDVWVGWWDGDDFGVVESRLIDLSRGGALVVMGVRPPRRQPIWFYKESADALATVRGYVVRAGASPDGGYAVRFRFASGCPTFFCQAVLCEQPPRTTPGRFRIVPP